MWWPVERDGTGIAVVSGAGSDSGPEAEGRENRRVVEERGECGWLEVLVALRNRMWMWLVVEWVLDWLEVVLD